jgi:UTP--glucose-1-phosphate uridylyltransferase
MRNQFGLFEEKMIAAGLPPLIIRTFEYYYAQLVSGSTGLIHESEIEPVPAGSLPSYEDVAAYRDQGKRALEHTAIIKLNGGLGTTMGLEGPKGLLPVKDGLSFFDIIAKQVLSMNASIGARIPLIMMNSFSTHAKTMECLRNYPDLSTDVAPMFLQHKFPKVVKQTLAPASYPANPELEWNPPGHGDLYTALMTSGILQQLLGRRIKYVFIANIDNLGATLDLGMLGYFSHHALPFMMEVAQRTPMDKKGGHLARRISDGRLILRERAQASADEVDRFQDIVTYGYFNTNTLWLNIEILNEIVSRRAILELPLIRNEKTLDPRDPSSPAVIQIETAMGAAIAVFQGAQAMVVPRSRFLPVKRCDELAALRSDRYCMNAAHEVNLNPACAEPAATLAFDQRFFGKVDMLDERFPHGIPSVVNCRSLTIKGDVRFGKGISISGDIIIENLSTSQVEIPDNTAITDSIIFP